MKEQGLFGAALAAIDPASLNWSMATRREGSPKPRADKSRPTNQQILKASRKVYQAHQRVVDLNTTSGVSYVSAPENASNLATLNGYDWKSQDTAPITPYAALVKQSPQMSEAVAANSQTADFASLVFGISESAEFIVGEEGGVGIAFGIGDQVDIQGTAYAAGKLGLDIDVAINLQVGIWAVPPPLLAGNFYGLEVNLDLDVGVSLGIFLTPDLDFYGFNIGIGAGLGGGVTAVDGYTWVF